MSDSLYDSIGGEAGVRALVDRFYDHMDAMPEAKTVRDLHAKNLRVSRDKLFMFLSGWMGGPSLYVEQYGHPRLRARHMPFKIGNPEALQWMMCMSKAIDETIEDPAIATQLVNSFTRVAAHMRNQ